MKNRRVSAVVVLLTVLGACVGQAQNTRSQLGVVSQTIAGTRVEIMYRRPVARGRDLFGSLVAWGRVWTPSADTAARLTTSGPLQINGSELPAGSYSVWAIPDSSSWTIVFNSVPEVFHLRYPEGRDVLRVRATPGTGEHVETLMFAFPVVDADSARLELRWGKTVVPLSIRAKH
jgi:Protein of unknown function (DUF2911)